MISRTWIFLLVLISLTSVQCTRSTEASKDLDALYIAIGAPPQTLDPRSATDATGMRLGHLLFSSLVRLGPNLEIVGEAAKSWEYLKADTTYRFYLQKDLKFSNGRTLTKEDYLFSLSEYQKPGSPFHAAGKIIQEVSYAEIEGEPVLNIKLAEFSATFLTDLTPMKILPQEEIQSGQMDFRKTLIGSGPYELVEWTDQQLTLKKRSTPYVTPRMDRLLFKIVRDDTTRMQRLLRGEIDVVQAEMPLDKVQTFKNQPEVFNVYEYPGLSMTYLLVNLKDPVLSQHSVRQALAHALETEEIIKYKFNELAEPATSILSPQNPYHHSGLTPYRHDLERAKQLLSEANLPEGASVTLKTSNAPAVVDHARILASQIEKLGLNPKLQSFEWGTFYSDISKGNFQVALMKWVGATDPDIYRIAFHSKELPPGRNRGSYVHPHLDRLLDEGVLLEDVTARKLHYQKVQEIVHQDLPMIPLWYEKQVAIARTSVTGFVPSPSGDFSGFMMSSKTQSKE